MLVFNDMFSFEVVEQISRVVLPLLAGTFAPHTLQSIFCCCSSDGLNPNQVQIIDVAPVFFTSSSVLLTLSAMFIQDDEYDDALHPAAARCSKFRG